MRALQGALVALAASGGLLLSACGGSASITASPPSAASPPPLGALTAWPAADNTGVPAGTVLKPVGALELTVPGAVVDGLDVSGCLSVRASNVTIRRSRIRGSSFCGSNLVSIAPAASGVLLEQVEIDGEGSNPFYAAVSGGGGYTCRRCNVHGAGQGFAVWGTQPVVIEDSFVHDLYVRDDLGSHNEDVITNGFTAGLVLRHDRLDNQDGQTAAISLFPDVAPVQRVTVTQNLLSGGGYTIYGGSTCPKPHCAETRDITVSGNHFSRKFFPKGGYYGPVADFDARAPGNVWSANVWDDTGQAVSP